KDHGYPHELWTMRLLARSGCGAWMPTWPRARRARFSATRKSSRTRLRYYLERRGAEFEQKMAEVQVLKKNTLKQTSQWRSSITMKDRGIQAIATTAAELPSPAFTRPSHATMSTSATAR